MRGADWGASGGAQEEETATDGLEEAEGAGGQAGLRRHCAGRGGRQHLGTGGRQGAGGKGASAQPQECDEHS